GRLGVRFAHQPPTVREQWGVELTTLSEDASALASLREFIAAVAQGPLRPDEFVIGDVTLYSEQELVWRKRLPARLSDNLVRASSAAAERRIRPLYRLRDAPAALPASDPLVARIAALLDETSAGPTPADVRAQLGELALLVQRLVDRRAELTGLSEAAELELLTAPVEPLIGELERRVRELARCDRELAELDEATLVRALAAVDAKHDDA